MVDVFTLDVVRAAAEGLEGDGSIGTMPDVTPAQAAVYMLRSLHKAGYDVVRRGDPLPAGTVVA